MARNGHTEIVQLLLGGGADVDKARTDDGSTPLYKAAGKGHTEIVQLLLGCGADVDKARTDLGRHPSVLGGARRARRNRTAAAGPRR